MSSYVIHTAACILVTSGFTGYVLKPRRPTLIHPTQVVGVGGLLNQPVHLALHRHRQRIDRCPALQLGVDDRELLAPQLRGVGALALALECAVPEPPHPTADVVLVSVPHPALLRPSTPAWRHPTHPGSVAPLRRPLQERIVDERLQDIAKHLAVVAQQPQRELTRLAKDA